MSVQIKRPKPIILVIMDGWGVAPTWGGNAVSLAKTPFMNMATKQFPSTTIQASGEAVGLQPGERGNSEVGHLNLGAGQIVLQYYPSIGKLIQNGDFFKNKALIDAFNQAKKKNKAVHIMGLVSPGGIHSHITHLFALMDMAKKQSFDEVYIHAITDGRDSSPFISQEYLSEVDTKIKKVGLGTIETVTGRYYAMDRDHRWERIEKSYRAMTEGVGPSANNAGAAVAAAYRKGFSDEFIPPTIIHGETKPFRPIMDGDSVIFFNFRGDRAREITSALVQSDFSGFQRKKTLKDLYFVGFTFYEEGLPVKIAFQPHDVKKPLASVLSDSGLKQLHIAESEKYAHVTYFFNGGVEQPFKNEDRIVIPSPKVPTYDQKPVMSCVEITDALIKNIDNYDFIVINYANPDMVAHTGNLDATIKACESVDIALGRIYKAIEDENAVMIITSDHGNAEELVNPKTGEPDTEHNASPVPFIIVGSKIPKYKLRPTGGLPDVTPTILYLMGLKLPSEMNGKNLIIKQLEV